MSGSCKGVVSLGFDQGLEDFGKLPVISSRFFPFFFEIFFDIGTGVEDFVPAATVGHYFGEESVFLRADASICEHQDLV